MREGSVEPPSRQDAKESIADPVPHAVLEATNSLGVLAPWRFTVAVPSASRLPEVPYAITLAPGGGTVPARVTLLYTRWDSGRPDSTQLTSTPATSTQPLRAECP